MARVTPRPVLFARLTIPGESRTEAVKEIVQALERGGGTAVGCAEVLGIPHRTLCRWMVKWPSLRTALDDARDRIRGL